MYVIVERSNSQCIFHFSLVMKCGGPTALMLAAERGHLDVVVKLIDAGAGMDITDKVTVVIIFDKK